MEGSYGTTRRQRVVERRESEWKCLALAGAWCGGAAR